MCLATAFVLCCFSVRNVVAIQADAFEAPVCCVGYLREFRGEVLGLYEYFLYSES
jgi:hypothetical protein